MCLHCSKIEIKHQKNFPAKNSFFQIIMSMKDFTFYIPKVHEKSKMHPWDALSIVK